MRVVLGVIAFLIGLGAATLLSGTSSWNRVTQSHIASLRPASPPPAVFDPASVGHLPAPVARYLQKAITNGHPMVRAVRATQEADFFINDGWRRLTATQHFSVSPPGFVWDARIEMAPLVPVLVRDGYVDRGGMMQASLYGVFSLADQIDRPELNAGELQRFLGEAIWFPTALLPSPTVTWTARDDRSASVTLTDGDLRATLLFAFGDNGMPVTISGDRYKEDNGRYSIQPWQISCGENAVRDGLTIPLRCEVAWVVNGVTRTYWRGRISSIEYQYDLME